MRETQEEFTHRKVREFFALHDALWAALDFEQLATLWDAQDPHPTYIGDEYWAPVEGWSALRQHLGRMEARIDQARLQSTVRWTRCVSRDVIVAVVLQDWHFRGVEGPEMHSGSAWVTAILRRSEAGLRMFHYMEASVYLPDEARDGLLG